MQHMQSGLRALGVEPRLFEAFADGADNMFHQLGGHSSEADKNAWWALGALEYLGLPVLTQDRVGSAYRKLSCTLAACRTWGVESENQPQRGQFLPGLQAHSSAMGQKDGEKWAAAADLQPTTPKSDRLLVSCQGSNATRRAP